MKTYRYQGYTLTLKETDGRMSTGQIKVQYCLKDKTGVIFEGEDFGASPMHDPESRASAESLLAFLTLCEGDTDAEYFDNYTPRQLTFRDNEAEALYFWRERLYPEGCK